MNPILTIAIPTYYNFRQLMECLVSLTLNVEFPYKVVVVNNGSAADRDGHSLESKIRERISFPQLEVLNLGENLGWCGGINRAFEQKCDTDYFMMCNDDVLFLRGENWFLRQLMGAFHWPEVGAVGPTSNYVMGSQNILNLHAPMIHITTLLIGFCMVVRSNLFSAIGGLDEWLPGGDDLDLSIYIRQAGSLLVVDRRCYVHHWGQQTGLRVDKNWNTPDYSERVNNALIHKHGYRAFYETRRASIDLFAPVTANGDEEGDLIRSWLPKEGPGLDLGCGPNKTRADAVGVDLVPKGQPCWNGGVKGRISVADVTAPAEATGLQGGSQRYIIARHLIEHLIDPLAALRHWKKLLVPGGTLVIAIPNEDNVRTIPMDCTHLHAFTPKSLWTLLEASGLEVEATQEIHPGISCVIKAVNHD